jgi:MFS family permease
MRPCLALLRENARLRAFFLAHAQSSLGTGAGYVGLLLLAYERARSPWVVALVLLADVLPAMAVGPLLGAASDRWSRRRCAVAADLLRAVAFVGIAAVGSVEATVAFALLAGLGTGLYLPAVAAGLPGLAGRARLPAAAALSDALVNAGVAVGPALAAAALLVVGPESLLAANGVTFALSALLLTRVPLGRAPSASSRARAGSLLRAAREGVRAAAALPGIRVVLLAGSAALLFGAAVNVGEVVLATDDLGAGATGYALLVAAYGAGATLGSLAIAGAASLQRTRRLVVAGLACEGAAIVASGLAPNAAVAVATFAVTGFGSGLAVAGERLLIQRTVPDAVMGRIFGVRDTLGAWAFAAAFAGAGGLAAVLGARPLFLLAGGAALLVAAGAGLALQPWGRAQPTAGPVRAEISTPRAAARAGAS